MGFLKNAVKKLQAETEKALREQLQKQQDGSGSSEMTRAPLQRGAEQELSISSLGATSATMSEVMHYGSTTTRWEKTVVATDSIVGEVTNFDPDGVEIVCVGGESPDGALDFDPDASDAADAALIEWHEGIKDTDGLEATITQKRPGGPCPLGKAMADVLTKALAKDLEKTPCSVLVLTAGKPDDSDLLEDALKSASQVVADHGGMKECPLSVTFIQIGNDQEASDYLKYLDLKMVGIMEESGEKVDIVDTMGFEELDETVKAMRGEIAKSEEAETKKKQAAVLSAVAGAAIGIGGVYLSDKLKGEKKGNWAGEWKSFFEEDEIATVTVTDDSDGKLTIEGLEGGTMTGSYDDDANLTFVEPDGEIVTGTFDAKTSTINWSDGTRWKSSSNKGGDSAWSKYVGAAAAGFLMAGATGYAINKKFFRKVGSEEACDYVLVLDRSDNMGITDSK